MVEASLPDRVSDDGAEGRAALRYSKVAAALHWTIAALIIYNLISGLLHDSIPRWFFNLHVSSGLTILLLTIVRIVWRLTHRPPPFLPMHAWERALAHVVHSLFYVAMIAMPLSGWALISASPPVGSAGAAYAEANPIRRPEGEARVGARPSAQAPAVARKKRGPQMLWGIVQVPLIAPINAIGRDPAGVPRQRALRQTFGGAHEIGGWIFLALLALHLAGALKHQFLDRHRELARMRLRRSEA